jgi:hypothetical protein
MRQDRSWWQLIKAGIKHFLFVGVLFAFVIGWALTIIVNRGLGWALHSVLGAQPEQYYLGSLLLTVVSIILIAGATVMGNRVFDQKGGLSHLDSRSLAASTLMFTVLVIVSTSFEIAAVMSTIMNHLSFFYEHRWRAPGLLSLPLLRIVGIPLVFFFVALILRRRRIAEPPEARGLHGA